MISAQPVMPKKLKLNGSMNTYKDLLELRSKKDIIFTVGDRNAKVESQETPGVISRFGLGVRNEAGQRLRVLQRKHIDHSKQHLPTTQEKTLHMDITRWSTLKSDCFTSN